jgi:hypothetical protein
VTVVDDSPGALVVVVELLESVAEVGVVDSLDSVGLLVPGVVFGSSGRGL